MSIVIFLVFGVVSLGISCAFVVYIFKGLREYGIMKAMGVTSGEVSFLIVTEVVLINIAACVAGGILGVASVFFFSKNGIDLSYWTSHNQYFVVSGEIFPRLTAYSLIGPPAASLSFGLISAVWPALLIARKKAVDILKVI
jgi:ABC-type lipoprotein release transport system permease subunit